MSQNSQKEVIFHIKIVVVASLSREKGIRAASDSVGEEKRPAAATDGYLADFFARQGRMFKTIQMKNRFEALQKSVFVLVGEQRANHARTGIDILFGAQKPHLLQADFFCQMKINAAPGIVQIGVRGINDEVVFTGFCYATFNVSPV